MNKRTIADRILDYFEKQPDRWVPKYEMETNFEKANFLVETGNRTLRKLAEDGYLEQREIKAGKAKVAHYKFISRQADTLQAAAERIAEQFGGYVMED